MVFGIEDDTFDHAVFRGETLDQVERSFNRIERLDRLLRGPNLVSQMLERQSRYQKAIEYQMSTPSRLQTVGEEMYRLEDLPNPTQMLEAIENAHTAISRFGQMVELRQNAISPTIFQVVENVQHGMRQIERLSFDFDRVLPTLEPQVSPHVVRREVAAYSPIVAYTLTEFAADLWSTIDVNERAILLVLIMASYYSFRLTNSEYTFQDCITDVVGSFIWYQMGRESRNE